MNKLRKKITSMKKVTRENKQTIINIASNIPFISLLAEHTHIHVQYNKRLIEYWPRNTKLATDNNSGKTLFFSANSCFYNRLAFNKISAWYNQMEIIEIVFFLPRAVWPTFLIS